MSYRENLTPASRMAVIEKQFAVFMDAARRQTTVETELEKLQPVFNRDIETAEGTLPQERLGFLG